MSKTVKKSSSRSMIWTKETVTEAINKLFNEFDMTVIREDSDSEDSDSEDFDSDDSDSDDSNRQVFYFKEDEKFIVKTSGIKQIKFKIFFRDFKPDYIDIEYFKSFHNGKQIISGTRLLNKFKTLGKILNVKYIKLHDYSKKRFNKCKDPFNLSVLEILTRTPSQSWYNSKGFVSDHHTENVEHNETQRNRLFKDIITKIKEKMTRKMKKSDAMLQVFVLDECVTSLCPLLSSKRYPDCRELTLYQVFRKLKNEYLLKDLQYYKLSTEECQSIHFIITQLERYIIKYKKHLKYTIPSQEYKLTSLKKSQTMSLRKTQTTSQKLSKQHSKTKKNKYNTL